MRRTFRGGRNVDELVPWISEEITAMCARTGIRGWVRFLGSLGGVTESFRTHRYDLRRRLLKPHTNSTASSTSIQRSKSTSSERSTAHACISLVITSTFTVVERCAFAYDSPSHVANDFTCEVTHQVHGRATTGEASGYLKKALPRECERLVRFACEAEKTPLSGLGAPREE